jgi:hypothetical protein
MENTSATEVNDSTIAFLPTQLDLSIQTPHSLQVHISQMSNMDIVDLLSSLFPPPGLDQHVVFQDMGRMTTIISDSGPRAISSEEEFSLSGIEDSNDEDGAPVPTATPPAHVAGPVGSKCNRKTNDAHAFFKLDGNNPRCYMCEFCECVIPIIMSMCC